MTYNPELDWMFDGNGQIDSSLLPSYVDDVLDGYIHEEGGVTSFYKTRTGSGTVEDPFVYSDPYVPAKGVIYNEISNEEKPISFRWTGAHFVQIGASDFIVTDPNFPASAANEGKVILYMGNSVGGGFQHGHFYECKLVDGVYVWEPLPHVDSIPLEAIDQLFTNYYYPIISEQVNFLDFPGLSRLVDKIYSKFVKKADIVDGLTSIEAAKPLSAKQGKVLNDGKADKKVPAANGNVATLDSNGNIADGGNTVSELTNVIEKIQRNGTDLSSPNKTVNVEVPILGLQVGGTDIDPDTNHKVNVPVDNLLKDNSVNPVQNKVVFTALRDVARQIIANSRDLSLYDIYGKLWAGRRTANCYVVTRPGTYRIALAYGSAIKDGADNPAAYTNNGGAYQAAFVNYLGNQITKPYIEEDTGVSAASAELSLADTDSIFTNISLVELDDCKYLVFNVESVPATGANGILSVLDASSNIMWSYHVWIWPDSLKTVEFPNHTGVKYNMLPVNLASKWDDATKAHIRNWHFQWGRKDPMCIPAAYNSNSNATLYGAKTFAATNADTVAEAIKRPHNFFKQYDAVSYNWNPLTYFWNFWDALCNSTGASDNLTTAIKTVYDPCPAGFIVPVGRAFTGFTATGGDTSESADFEVVGSFSAGWYFKANGDDLIGQFFPASGGRNRESGGLYNVGSYGYCWSSAADSQAGACSPGFGSGLVGPLGCGSRANGFSVRPVRELS